MRTKTCSDCKLELSLDNFQSRTVNGKKYPMARCRACRSEYDKRRDKKSRSPESIRLNRRKSQEKESFERENGINIAKYIFTDCRGSDRKKKRDFDLDIPFVEMLIQQPCFYCEDVDSRMTLDRIDNSRGHTKDNVVQCCLRCNLVRGPMPYEAWMYLVDGMKAARIAGAFGDWSGKGFVGKSKGA